MHENYRDFLSDLDAENANDVAFGRKLDIGVKDGIQSFPPPSTSDVANRLLIFTGTPMFELRGQESQFTRGIFRVRLQFKISGTVRFVGSATVAALSSIHGGDEEDAVFAVDGAEVRVGPDGGVGLPDNGLPADELYLFLDAAIYGEESVLGRLSYQANVLVLDTEPDIERVGVRESGTSDPFINNIGLLNGRKWDIEVVLTGENLGPDPFPYTVSTSKTWRMFRLISLNRSSRCHHLPRRPRPACAIP